MGRFLRTSLRLHGFIVLRAFSRIRILNPGIRIAPSPDRLQARSSHLDLSPRCFPRTRQFRLTWGPKHYVSVELDKSRYHGFRA
jgi:hypothetical protein